jgi:IS5 family transposase
MATRPGQRRALPDTPDWTMQYLIQTAKAHICAKVQHPFCVIRHQLRFQNIRLRGLAINRCKNYVLATLSTLFMTRCQLLEAS